MAKNIQEIFISYRRQDSAAETGRIYDRLVQKFGKDTIFKDVDTIPMGMDFRECLNNAMENCNVLLVVIGKEWISVTDDKGRRRLNNPADYVRLEIEIALQRNIPVIPLLVQGVSMPRADDLPSSLSNLAYRNGLPVRNDPDFHKDINQLVKHLIDQYNIGFSHASIRHGEPSRSERFSTLVITSPINMELVQIPAGEFIMGSDPKIDKDTHEYEQPQHSLYLDEYYIGITPVTNLQYEAFVKATNRRKPLSWNILGKIPFGKNDHPVVSVTWGDVWAFCQWLERNVNKHFRLPTEAEWEKAARGTDGRIFPWGNDWSKKKCNAPFTGSDERIATSSVGKFSPLGDSPYGCADMAGNVFEMTLSLWGKQSFWDAIKGGGLDYRYPYDPQDGRENLEASNDFSRVQRGGSYVFGRKAARCAHRSPFIGKNVPSDRGFRVVVSTSHHIS